MLEFRHEHPVFPVKGHRQQVLGRVLARIEKLLADIIDVGDEIRNRRFWRHGSVLEGNAVGNHPVAEDNGHFATLCPRHGPWCSQIGGILNIDQLPVAIG